jgi:hypothetical protein
MIQDVHPGSGSWFFTHPGSTGQKRHRIEDPDPQHWKIFCEIIRIFCLQETRGAWDPTARRPDTREQLSESGSLSSRGRRTSAGWSLLLHRNVPGTVSFIRGFFMGLIFLWIRILFCPPASRSRLIFMGPIGYNLFGIIYVLYRSVRLRQLYILKVSNKSQITHL